MTKPRTLPSHIPNLALLAQSDDERDKNLYKKIIAMDMSPRGRAGPTFRTHSNKLRDMARKRLAGISWKEINAKHVY